MFLAGAIETDAERFIAAVRRSRDLHSFVYWLETTYTPKPTIQVVHVVVDRRKRVGRRRTRGPGRVEADLANLHSADAAVEKRDQGDVGSRATIYAAEDRRR